MHSHIPLRWICCVLVVIVAAGAKPGAGALPSGRQYRLTIGGESTVTFSPQMGLDPLRIDYRARVEYLVNTRNRADANAKGTVAVKKKTSRKSSSALDKAKGKGADQAGSNVASAVDVALHAAELKYSRNGQVVVESRTSRTRFLGRFLPDAPVLSVSYNEAPPRLQEALKTFDVPVASILLDDRANVVDRRVRIDGPFHAIIETLLSIHTPIPKDVGFWEAPTQLAMGHGQTAKGTLRFEKDKQSIRQADGLVRVKVTGVLKAEGAVVGKFIKDGTYSVTGEQDYDPRSREWKSARWSVAVDNELANPDGMTVAHVQGTMLVQSEALDGSPSTTAPITKP